MSTKQCCGSRQGKLATKVCDPQGAGSNCPAMGWVEDYEDCSPFQIGYSWGVIVSLGMSGGWNPFFLPSNLKYPHVFISYASEPEEGIAGEPKIGQ